MIVGLDWIPVGADLSERSATQSTLGAKTTTATSGTNKGKATIEDHMTYYIQPGFVYGNTMLYLTAGWVRADIDAIVSTVDSSTITNKVQSLDGTKFGVGLKYDFGNSMFVKVDWSETDYDTVSYKTSTNSTTVTGDLDNTASSLSLGITF